MNTVKKILAKATQKYLHTKSDPKAFIESILEDYKRVSMR